MDQHETWHGVGLNPGHIVLDGDPAPPPPKRHSQFSTRVYFGQTGGWIKVVLVMEVRLVCAKWGPSSPSKNGAEPTQFSGHVYCGQTSGWIKMTLIIEVALGPRHILLDWDQAPLPQKGVSNFWSMTVVAKRLNGS